MPCNHVTLPGGGYAIICSRGRRPRPCACCNLPSTKLCDFPTGNGKTCDLPLCDKCAVKGGPNVDFCPGHERLQL